MSAGSPSAELEASPVNRIVQGDCVWAWPRYQPESVDLVFADPPFNIGYDYDVYHDRREHEHYLGWVAAVDHRSHRLLKPDGGFWLAIGGDYAAELKLLSQHLGFHSRARWFGTTFGVNCTKVHRARTRTCSTSVKDPQQFVPGRRAGEPDPSARGNSSTTTTARIPRGRLPDDTWILRPRNMADCFTADEDTWYFHASPGRSKREPVTTAHPDARTTAGPHHSSLLARRRVSARPVRRQRVVADHLRWAWFVGLNSGRSMRLAARERLEQVNVGDPLVRSADPTRLALDDARAKGEGGRGKGGTTAKEQPHTNEAPSTTNQESDQEDPEPRTLNPEPKGANASLVELFIVPVAVSQLDRVAAGPRVAARPGWQRTCRARWKCRRFEVVECVVVRLRLAENSPACRPRCEPSWPGRIGRKHSCPRPRRRWRCCSAATPRRVSTICSAIRRGRRVRRLAALRYGGRKKTFEYRWALLRAAESGRSFIGRRLA